MQFGDFLRFFARSFNQVKPEEDFKNTFDLMDPKGTGFVDSKLFTSVIVGLLAEDVDGDIDQALDKFHSMISEAFPSGDESLYSRLWHERGVVSFDSYVHFLSC